MKIQSPAFNTFLFGAMALAIVLSGCATGSGSDTKKSKDPVAIRFHIEGDGGTPERTISVSVLRSSPMRLKIDGDSFLDESFIKHASVIDTIGGFDLRIEVDQQGTWILQNITAANRGRRVAIFCDFGEKRWLAAHMLDRVVTDGVFAFTPDASREEAEQIVDGLNKTIDKERRRGEDVVSGRWGVLAAAASFTIIALAFVACRPSQLKPSPDSGGSAGATNDSGRTGSTQVSPASRVEPSAVFQLPTANGALFEAGREGEYFAGTSGKAWTSGTFGCVRTEGWQFHEGIDIRAVARDRKGEPTDPVLASADGEVVYVNRTAGLSNYGQYVVLRHRVEGMDVYSLYAHLQRVEMPVRAGAAVRAGQSIGVLGRTANTRERITKDRAHVHFEIALLLNPRFGLWASTASSGERNDHGNWNGQALVGIDPAEVLRRQQTEGRKFSFVRMLHAQTPLCRVRVRVTEFPWLRQYPQLVHPNPKVEKEGVAGYEVALNFSGVPFALMPRTPAELGGGRERFALVHVNEEEQAKHPCGRLVTKDSGKWELTERGRSVLGLLTY